MFEEQRAKIDEYDRQIVKLLGERFQVVREVGHIKTKNNAVIVQTARCEEVLDHVAMLGEKHNFSPDVLRHIYTILIDYAHDLESAIKENSKAA